MFSADRIVLVADDDSAVRDALKFSLELDGFTVHACRNGEALLAHPSLATCDCIVLDYRMPGLNGLQVLWKLRAAGIKAPVIFIAGPVTRALRDQAIQAGARCVLEKPLLDGALTAKIREITN
jgi:FixJ family two-component response regulator